MNGTWIIGKLSTQSAIDLFGILEARENRAVTLIAMQLEPQEWCLRIEDELMADSILGRAVSVAHYLNLEGPSMRECFTRMRDGRDGTS